MNRQTPPFNAIPSAWASLPADTQARLGCMLIEYAFADFVSGESSFPHDQYCTSEIREDASRRCQKLLGGMNDAVMDLLPNLFGSEQQDPPWAWRDPEEYETAIEVDLLEIAEKRAAVERMQLAVAMQKDQDTGVEGQP